MKDPFKDLPTLEPEDDGPHHPAPAFNEPATESPSEIAASSPPRTLVKNISKFAVPVAFLAVMGWLFFSPETPSNGRRFEQQKVDVDPKLQEQETERAMASLRADAEKRRPVVVPVMPGSQPAAPHPSQPGQVGTVASATPPLPSGMSATPRAAYVPAATSPTQGQKVGSYPVMPGQPAAALDEAAQKEAQKRVTDELKRQEDIRAAPLEAQGGQIRLLGQGGGADAAKTPGALSDLHADIANEKAEAVRSQQSLQDQLLAAMTPQQEQPRSRGSNQDFLTAAASAANARPAVATVQAPAGRYLVGEGTIIRAVLLTNVNSDMPGRFLARVTSDVYDDQKRRVMIPKGSLINGLNNSQVVVGQSRLLMAATRMTLPNGNWISLNGASVADAMGASGVDADVNNHFFKMFSSSMIIGASTLMLPRADTTVTTVPGNSGNGSGTPTVGSVFATTLSDVVRNLLDRNKNIAPTLSLSAGQQFIFMANQDMLMLPYE